MTESAASTAELALRPDPAASLASLRGFRPDIQVLRGIAVLAVVLYHAQVVLPGGFVGVDMFFVISGYVIGRLLLSSLRSSSGVGFRQFYIRRARRLLPALALTLTAVVVVSPLLAPIGALAETPRTGATAALFNANTYLYAVTGSGYFTPAAELNPLLHTWSLSVEEQFYFAMPVLLVGAWVMARRWRRGLTGARSMTVLLLIASLGACIWFTTTATVGPLDGPRFAFFSPVTRAWEFAIGLGLVLLPAGTFAHPIVRRVAAAIGIALVAAAMLLFSDTTVFPGAAALLPALGTAMLIFSATTPRAEPTPRARVSGWRAPLGWMGDVSYSWYLWHWPLIVFAGALWPNAGATPLVVAATLSLLPAWASYRFVEQRFKATSATRTAPTLRLVGVCMGAALLAAAVTVPLSTVTGRRRTVSAFETSLRQHADLPSGCRGNAPLDDRDPKTCRWGYPDAPTSVVLIGDSNAGQWSEAFIAAATHRDDLNVRIATMSSCPFSDVLLEEPDDPTFPTQQCHRFARGSVDDLIEAPPDVVVIANATDRYAVLDGPRLIDPDTGERSDGAGRSAMFQRGLERVIARLHGAGIKVIVVNVVPKPGDWDPRECSRLTLMWKPANCVSPTFGLDERPELATAVGIERAAAAAGGAEVWNFNDRICPDRRCVGQRRPGSLVWRDGGHISVNESKLLAPAVARKLAG